jgi:protein O-mannosyl-transferase
VNTASGYTIGGITPSEQKKQTTPKDYLFALSAGAVLIVACWLGVWSDHFGNSFHFDDIPAIVTNSSLSHLSNIPQFFINPRIFSAAKETSDYRPLLSTWFALDYWLGGGAKPFIFLSESFAWFGMQLLIIFLLFRVIPGGNYVSALFGALICAFHPIAADTVNYPLQRGVIIGSFGVVAGMFLWIVWPRFLPQKLPITLKRVPQHGLDEYLRNNFKLLENRYLKLIHFPVALYLWPVVPALLADPAASVFAPILLAYILLFETERQWRHAIPAAVICGVYWIFQTVFTWPFGALSRPPIWNYWFTQPWVALRYLFDFFLPVHLSADTDLNAFAQFWSPLALAGYAGVATLVALAIFLGRRSEWRAVAFGIWWFLIALTPYAAVPHRVVEADWRMYLALAGLALAVSRTAWIVFALLSQQPRTRLAAAIAAAAVALVLLVALGWGTYRRNAVWESEATLWSDVMAKSPLNGLGFMNFGLTRIAQEDPLSAISYFVRGEALSPRDPDIEINLARAYDKLSRTAEAETHFKRAIADGPSYSPAYSAYSQWLLSQGAVAAGMDMARKALGLDPYDLTAHRTVLDVIAQQHQWIDLKRAATETLHFYPNDADGIRALMVAQTGIDQVIPAEKTAGQEPSVDHYLFLSVQYFENQRYEDCIRAAREALKIDPNLGEAYANIATAYHTMGRTDEAIAALQQEVRINPNLRSATRNLNVELAIKARSGH